MVKATGRRSTVVAAACAVALAFSQGSAYAASGWTLGPDSTVGVGDFQVAPAVSCGQGPCSYNSDWHLNARALNDAAFKNSVGSSLALVKHGSGTRVGTCTVDSSTAVDCRLDTSGTVSTNDYLTTTSYLLVGSPSTTCTDALTLTWHNPQESMFRAISTTGRC
jgi:hypothetical protein